MTTSRREFCLLPGLLVAAGAPTLDVDARLIEMLGRPVEAPQPIGDYVPARRVAGLVFLSTTPAKRGARIMFPGVVGRDLDLAAGIIAAQWAALTLLEYLFIELGGTLSAVKQFVSLTGYVSSEEGFHQQAEVMNGATRVLTGIFGAERGRPTRSSIGVRHMPRNASVAVSGIVEINRL